MIKINLTKQQVKRSVIKNIKSFMNILPILISIMLLISLINSLVSNDFYSKIFTNNDFLNALIAGFFGSVLAGNPISAYIIGLNLMQHNISLFVITTFILTWTTVGIIQFPAESVLMGKKFAFYRNLIAFIFAIIISFIAVIINGVL